TPLLPGPAPTAAAAVLPDPAATTAAAVLPEPAAATAAAAVGLAVAVADAVAVAVTVCAGARYRHAAVEHRSRDPACERQAADALHPAGSPGVHQLQLRRFDVRQHAGDHGAVARD